MAEGLSFVLSHLGAAAGLWLMVCVPLHVGLCLRPSGLLGPWQVRVLRDHVLWKHEVTGTLGSFVVLAITLGTMAWARETGWLTIREGWGGDDLGWDLLSLPLVVLAHDAYFYWTHRLMHAWPWLLKRHNFHHRATVPTPLSVFSFHPVEAAIHFGFFLVFPFVVPVSMGTLYFMWFFMFAANTAGHMPYEFYPRFLYDFPLLRESNSATHHSMHHSHPRSNFGLYYNFWDRWAETNHRDYFKRFREVKATTLERLAARREPLNPTFQRLTRGIRRARQGRVHQHGQDLATVQGAAHGPERLGPQHGRVAEPIERRP